MIFIILLLPILAHTADLPIKKESLDKIGLKVWQNECHGTLDGLIYWNPNEEFPSLGIGHFIWYPEGTESKFEEGFPALIAFLEPRLKERELKIPSWLKSKKGFPWKTRDDFLKDKRSKKVQELRNFLSDTLDLQILFLLERFQIAEEQILPKLSPLQKIHLETLKSTPQGIYALIDYVNFKGTGLSPSEKYLGMGWGLLQVLQNIPDETSREKTLEAFVTSAKQVLTRRVKNAPIHRKEDKFLIGWSKRLETYLESS